ncbi:LETM1-like protein-domain-containing protein [Gilbertella persicaria]|nr:LETM1-like protein-domain-containing protein [Gilbertella persicaria]KAI8098424.1 LETM1-like protein-domain-containing protein [Gilbertella persicaria]
MDPKEILKRIETIEKNNKPSKEVKKSMWQKVKDEATHYWHGMKLLGLDIKISSRLTYKLLTGSTLTRREHRQLRRTTADIVRLVPLSVFLMVPFMEFLLPVALKVFPNMLPSTFENKKIQEEKKLKLVKVRLEMAKFLQETIAESGQNGSLVDTTHGQEFVDFFRKMRTTGEQPSTEDLIKIASKFEDELTLDNLSRPQLISMCRYMNIKAFGTDNFLRFQIQNHMRQLKLDDQAIQQEGIDHLTTTELHAACAARGIRTIGASNERLRGELAQWLDLQLNHHVPWTLLILSRAFCFTDGMTHEEALRATFNSLPDNLVNEAELHMLETMGTSTYKQKLDVLEQQEEMIEDESEQEEKEKKVHEALSEKMPSDADHKGLTEEQKDNFQKALSKLRSKVDFLGQRAQLNEIKFHHKDYKQLVEDIRAATNKESNVSASRLSKRLEKMLNALDKELDSLENEDQEKEKKEEKRAQAQ